MLVLTRKNGQGIWVGDEIALRVLRIKGSSVVLGFTAPPSIPILRQELSERPTGRKSHCTGCGRYVRPVLVHSESVTYHDCPHCGEMINFDCYG